jgi:CRISPR-associated endonuclease Cas1
VVGADGTAYFTNTPRLNDDPRLRRTQALAANQEVGLRISRLLLAAKVDGQALNVSKRLRDLDTAVALGRLAQAIEVAETVEQVRQAEAAAANLYWRAWCARPEVTLRFAAKDRGRVPDHWSQFEGRRSLLTGATNNRKAERPINAILNYAYALLECEAVRACHVVGLDPGLAVVHMDREGRQSMALDLMEPVRPAVEEFVLKLVASRQFRKADFVELADGTCRLKAPLTHELCESLPLWGRKVAPYAEKVSHLLGEALTGKYTARTPLTRARNIAAQELLKETKHERKARQAGLDPALFQERILPKLTGIRLALLSEVTGISIGHCSEMRRGQYVPNVSTWPALAELVGVDIVAPGLPADA